MPTERQIKLVDKINSILHTEFPQSSDEYTEGTFEKFIKEHLKQISDNSDIFYIVNED